MPYRINPITGELDLVSVTSATNPVLFNGGTGVISMLVATNAQDGYLSFTDWISFNAKQNALLPLITTPNSGAATLVGNQLTIPNYTLAGLGGIGLTALSALGALTYNNTTGVFNMPAATSINNGYLTFTDHSIFSAKQNALTLLTPTTSLPATLTGVNNNVLTIPTYTLAGLGGISLTSLAATSPMTYTTGGGIGTFGMPMASGTVSGYLNTVHWTVFNNKQANIVAGTTSQYYRGDKTFQTLDTTAVIEATNLYYTDARARAAITLNTAPTSGSSTYVGGLLTIPTYTLAGLGGVPSSRSLTINGTAYDLSANRSWSVGTVTSVAALTLTTLGTDVSSTVATGTTTPVITLNIPTASGSNRGALSSTDWSTFNGKQVALTLTTTGSGPASLSVGGALNIPYAAPATYLFSAPLVNTAGTVSIGVASAGGNGYLTSTDWTTFNSKANTGSPLSQFAATTSLQLYGVMSDKTGTGSLVFGTGPTLTSPILVTPNLGDAVASTLTARILPRVLSITSSSAPSINTDLYDAVSITALAVNMIAPGISITGSANNFDKMIFRIKDTGTAKGLIWSSSFISMGAALPTTTIASKVLTVGFIYDSILSKWGCVVTAQEA